MVGNPPINPVIEGYAVIQDWRPADGSAGDFYEKGLLSQVGSFRAEDKSRVTMQVRHSSYIRIRRTQ